MKRIAFISTNDWTPWSGSEELWSQAAISMANQGLTIGINIKGWKPIPLKIQEIEQSNCCVIRRWYDSNFTSNLAFVTDNLTFEVFKDKLLCGWLDKFDPDLVVISQGYNLEDKGWMQACLRRNIPYAVIFMLRWKITGRLIKWRQLSPRGIKVLKDVFLCLRAI